MLDYIIFNIFCAIVAYPIMGGALYGDPWTWIFEEDNKQ